MKTSNRINRNRRLRKSKHEAEEVTNLSLDTICEICNAEFLDLEDLERHTFQLHMNKSSRQRYCTFCKIKFSDIESFVLHLRNEHIMSLKVCDLCCRVFNDEAKLLMHRKAHQMVSKNMFSCSQCSVLFRDTSELENHEFEAHEDLQEGMILKTSYPHLSSIINMSARNFLKSLGKSFQYGCAKCRFKTSNVGSYVKHLKKKNCRSLACDSCCRVYRFVKPFAKHFEGHTRCMEVLQWKGIEFKCKTCDKVLDYVTYKKHLKNCVPAIRCKFCNITFKNIVDLSVHQNREHPAVVTLKICKFCQNEFVGTSALQKHIDRIHKSEIHLYKYECKSCNYLFKHPKNLFTHFFAKHKNLDPYICKICDLKFKVRRKFTLHIKLEHKSLGNVEFDKNFHVFFSDENYKHAHNFMTDHDYSSANKDADSSKTLDCNKTAEAEGEDRKLQSDEECNNKGNEDEEELSNEEYSVEYLDVDEPYTDLEHSIINEQCRRLSTDKQKPMESIEKANSNKNAQDVNLESSDDDTPLALIVGKDSKKVKKNSSKVRLMKERFRCRHCKKYCYTFQNFNRHMSLHSNRESKQCLKCRKLFKKTSDLELHMKRVHAKSKLTETLKDILERRRKGLPPKTFDMTLTNAERFRLTVKKVDMNSYFSVPKAAVKATNLDSNISVKNFLESFTPEETISTQERASLRFIRNPQVRPPQIAMKKVNMTKQYFTKLSMPVKFRKSYLDVGKAKLKVHQGPARKKVKLNFGLRVETVPSSEDYNVETCNEQYSTNDDDGAHYDEVDDHVLNDDAYEQSYDNLLNEGNTIPDVAQEVFLEGTVETSSAKPVQRKILIPQLPKDYSGMHVAHLLPQAPYYAIVKVSELLEKEQKEQKPAEVELPEGTKLVPVNPLEHLLKGRKVDLYKNKYYKPKERDVKKVFAKAFQNLAEPPVKKVQTYGRKKKEHYAEV